MVFLFLLLSEMYKIKVAMKLAPDRKKFMEVLGGSGNIYGEMEKFCTTFSPILQEIHKFLVRYHQIKGLYSYKNGTSGPWVICFRYILNLSIIIVSIFLWKRCLFFCESGIFLFIIFVNVLLHWWDGKINT